MGESSDKEPQEGIVFRENRTDHIKENKIPYTTLEEPDQTSEQPLMTWHCGHCGNQALNSKLSCPSCGAQADLKETHPWPEPATEREEPPKENAEISESLKPEQTTEPKPKPESPKEPTQLSTEAKPMSQPTPDYSHAGTYVKYVTDTCEKKGGKWGCNIGCFGAIALAAAGFWYSKDIAQWIALNAIKAKYELIKRATPLKEMTPKQREANAGLVAKIIAERGAEGKGTDKGYKTLVTDMTHVIYKVAENDPAIVVEVKSIEPNTGYPTTTILVDQGVDGVVDKIQWIVPYQVVDNDGNPVKDGKGKNKIATETHTLEEISTLGERQAGKTDDYRREKAQALYDQTLQRLLDFREVPEADVSSIDSALDDGLSK